MRSPRKHNDAYSMSAVLFVEGKTECEFFKSTKGQLPFKKVRIRNKRGRDTLLKEAKKDFERVRRAYGNVVVIWILDTEGEDVQRLQKHFPSDALCIVGYAKPQFAAWLLADLRAVEKAAKSEVPASIARKNPEELSLPENHLIKLLGNSDKVTTALRVARHFSCKRARKRAGSLKKFCEQLETFLMGNQ